MFTKNSLWLCQKAPQSPPPPPSCSRNYVLQLKYVRLGESTNNHDNAAVTITFEASLQMKESRKWIIKKFNSTKKQKDMKYHPKFSVTLRARGEWWREEKRLPLPDTHPFTPVTGAHQSCSQQRQLEWFELSTHHNKRSWRISPLVCMIVCVFHDRDIHGLVYLASVLSSKDTGESSIVAPEFSCYPFSSGSWHQRGVLQKCKMHAHTHVRTPKSIKKCKDILSAHVRCMQMYTGQKDT